MSEETEPWGPPEAGRSRTSARAVANRRMSLAVGATLLIGGIVAWLLLANSGSRRRAPQQSKQPAPTAVTNYPALGLRVLKPSGWNASVKRGVVELLSADQSASVAVSAPAPAGQTSALSQSDKQQLLRLFPPARVLGQGTGTIGGQPVKTSELVGQTASHHKIRILSTAVSSRYRTYSVQVFSTLRPGAARLLEVRSVLHSISFFAPTP